MINESEKRSKDNKLLQKYIDFTQELFCSEGMYIFFYKYLNFNYDQAIKDIKEFIYESISDIYNPFYYQWISKDLNKIMK